MGGSFVCSLVATDVCTGRTEAVPMLAREQSLVAAGLEAIAGQLPFPVLGIDSDNDSVFIKRHSHLVAPFVEQPPLCGVDALGVVGEDGLQGGGDALVGGPQG